MKAETLFEHFCENFLRSIWTFTNNISSQSFINLQLNYMPFWAVPEQKQFEFFPDFHRFFRVGGKNFFPVVLYQEEKNSQIIFSNRSNLIKNFVNSQLNPMFKISQDLESSLRKAIPEYPGLTLFQVISDYSRLFVICIKILLQNGHSMYVFD